MNRKNLKLLADYLMALPEDYQHFDMWRYSIGHDMPAHITSNSCGTAGCAIGHAPYVKGLLKPMSTESWLAYSDRIFNLYCDEWDWCFDCSWVDIDNTPHGAAKRIYWLLEHGLPDDWEYQLTGDAELCYNEMKGE